MRTWRNYLDWKMGGEGVRIFKCAIPFVIALAIIYCAYIGETMCVSVLSSSLALYAARGYLKGGD